MRAYLKIYRKAILILLGVLAVLGFLTYSFISPYGMFSDLQNDLKTIEPEEGAEYTDLDGNPVDLATFKGKPLIVNAWATWIPFSQTELPLLIQAKETYGDEITILAINRMEETIRIRSFLSTFAISENTILFLTDPTDYFYRVTGGYAMPERIFYRPDGTIEMHKRGVLTKEELSATIDTLLAR